MNDEEILAEFRAAQALLEGHFILSSGKRSANYLQCARVLMDPERAGRLARALAQKIPREIRSDIDIVVSPAMGGVIIGHEMGRALGVEAIFLERPEGVFELRRGFTLKEGRSEEHTSEIQSQMRNSDAGFCLKKKQQSQHHQGRSKPQCNLTNTRQ